MRYREIIETKTPVDDAERDQQQHAEASRKLDDARRKRGKSAQDYQDRIRTADDEQRKAEQRLAEVGNNSSDHDAERERWKRYWANQQRLNRALAADDSEKRRRYLLGSVSTTLRAPACGHSASGQNLTLGTR
jgi:hypothetical protein